MNDNYSAPTGYTFREWETIGTTLYVGYSPIGSTEDDNWLIKKIIDDGSNGSVRRAEGAWVDKQTLLYR